jgi:hypothetical protein
LFQTAQSVTQSALWSLAEVGMTAGFHEVMVGMAFAAAPACETSVEWPHQPSVHRPGCDRETDVLMGFCARCHSLG